MTPFNHIVDDRQQIVSENSTLEVLTLLGIVAVLKIGNAALSARHGVKLAVSLNRARPIVARGNRCGS
jgi:hypothetical protein